MFALQATLESIACTFQVRACPRAACALDGQYISSSLKYFVPDTVSCAASPELVIW